MNALSQAWYDDRNYNLLSANNTWVPEWQQCVINIGIEVNVWPICMARMLGGCNVHHTGINPDYPATSSVQNIPFEELFSDPGFVDANQNQLQATSDAAAGKGAYNGPNAISL